MQEKNFSIINETKTKIPPLPFIAMKEAVLGKNHELSLVFVGEKKIQELNRIYHRKNKPTDVLSFPISKTSGDIFICPSETKRQAKDFDKNFTQFLGFLFIHGMLHLKGYAHSSRMERAEKKFVRKFDL